MSTARRALLSVRRHPTRSFLFGALLTLVFTILIAHMGIRTALRTSASSLRHFTHTGVVLNGTGASLSPDYLKEAEKVTGAQCAPALFTTITASGISPLNSDNESLLNSEVASQFGVLGLSDIAHLPALMDTLRVTPSSAAANTSSLLSPSTAYVHEDVAHANNLTLGSHVTLMREGVSVTVRVVGFLTGSNDRTFLIPSERPDNTLVLDPESARMLAGTDEPRKAFCPMSKEADITPAVSSLQHSLGSDVEVRNASASRIRAVNALASVTTLLNLVFVCVIIFGIGVLSFTFILQIRGRVHEIGVLMALGESKKNISAQLLIENMILALVAAPFAIFVGDWATQKLADSVASRLGHPSAMFLADSTASSANILLALLAGMGVLILALLLAFIPLARRSTREILAATS